MFSVAAALTYKYEVRDAYDSVHQIPWRDLTFQPTALFCTVMNNLRDYILYVRLINYTQDHARVVCCVCDDVPSGQLYSCLLASVMLDYCY